MIDSGSISLLDQVYVVEDTLDVSESKVLDKKETLDSGKEWTVFESKDKKKKSLENANTVKITKRKAIQVARKECELLKIESKRSLGKEIESSEIVLLKGK